MKVRMRDEKFATRTLTKICYESPSEENPYVAEKMLVHGYNLVDLMNKRSYIDVIYLAFRGELPCRLDSEILESFSISLSIPSPRHSASRAAMVASSGKTDPSNILPIGLSVMSGEYLGAKEVYDAMYFFKKNKRHCPLEKAQELVRGVDEDTDRLAPGFGKMFGSVDNFTKSVVDTMLSKSEELETLRWGNEFVAELERNGHGWLTPGVAAAVFLDLGFKIRQGPGLFQLLSSPGLLAYGLEMHEKPTSAMPYISQDNYHIVE